MGRGRAKAKQTKVARELKYSSQGTDLEALQRELAGSGSVDRSRDDRRPTRTSTTTTTTGRPATSADLRALHDREAARRLPADRIPLTIMSAARIGAAERLGGGRDRAADPGVHAAVAAARRTARVGGVRRRRRRPSDAHVERALQLVARHAADLADQRRRPAAATRSPGRRWRDTSAGSTRARLAASPPPVTCAKACTSTRLDQRQAVAGVDPGRLEQLLAERAAELGRRARSSDQPAARRAARGAPASSRWSAGRSTPSRPPRRPSRTRSGAEQPVGLDDAGAGAGDVVLVRAPAAPGARRSRRRPARSRRARSPRRCP